MNLQTRTNKVFLANPGCVVAPAPLSPFAVALRRPSRARAAAILRDGRAQAPPKFWRVPPPESMVGLGEETLLLLEALAEALGGAGSPEDKRCERERSLLRSLAPCAPLPPAPPWPFWWTGQRLVLSPQSTPLSAHPAHPSNHMEPSLNALMLMRSCSWAGGTGGTVHRATLLPQELKAQPSESPGQAPLELGICSRSPLPRPSRCLSLAQGGSVPAGQRSAGLR